MFPSPKSLLRHGNNRLDIAEQDKQSRLLFASFGSTYTLPPRLRPCYVGILYIERTNNHHKTDFSFERPSASLSYQRQPPFKPIVAPSFCSSVHWLAYGIPSSQPTIASPPRAPLLFSIEAVDCPGRKEGKRKKKKKKKKKKTKGRKAKREQRNQKRACAEHRYSKAASNCLHLIRGVSDTRPGECTSSAHQHHICRSAVFSP